ncbi:MAG: type II toxin-antitoxin system prevent-host-death family antitoxin [Chloroflexi bacterium]|nr:type II toxin-antitoxin system prevent-host-death family antitoxin [Chloroflexota bacterium]
MQQSIGIAEARQNLPDLVNQVAFGKTRYVVERRGKPLAALISAEEYRQIMALLGDGGISDRLHGIPVRVRFDGERYWVGDNDLDLYGVGDTIEDARQDYWLAAQDYYADLSANAGHLASPLQAHLEILRRIFAAEGEK